MMNEYVIKLYMFLYMPLAFLKLKATMQVWTLCCYVASVCLTHHVPQVVAVSEALFKASHTPRLPVLGSGILPRSFGVSHGPQWSCEVFQPSQGKFYGFCVKHE